MATKQLKSPTDEPRFLAVGFYRPHVPQYAPQKCFDLYPAESVQLPQALDKDLGDLFPYALNPTSPHHVSPNQGWVIENDQWVPLVQSHLASASFGDAQVGKPLDAYDNSSLADKTYTVLFSSYVFSLGKKVHWAKSSLWEDGTGVPLTIVGPRISGG